MTTATTLLVQETQTLTGLECPPWAAGVRRSITAANGAGALDAMDERITEYVDPQTQLMVMRGRGVHVVVVDHPFGLERFWEATKFLRQLRTHPLEIAALALAPGITPPPELVVKLADVGLAVVRDEGESAHARASNYLQRFMALRAEGQAHLRRSMGMDEPRPRRVRSHARR